MVKTRGLGHALGRRRRPTASARRRRVPVIVDDVVPAVPTDSPAIREVEAAVAGDEPMVDADAQDTGPETGAQDIGAQDAADEPEGFPGRPRDPSVLTEYADHVAANAWSEQVFIIFKSVKYSFLLKRPQLKLSFHGRKMHNLGRPIPAIDDMVAGTGLSPLIACSIDTSDRGLISSFVERWHRETSSFHLPVGEVSITLDDVMSLLYLPIVGAFHDFQPLRTDEVVVLLVDLLMVSAEVTMAEIGECGGPYLRLADVRRSTGQLPLALIFYIFWVTLFFANKSATHVHVSHLQALCDLTLAGRAAGLVHMYDQLNDANLSTSRQLAGYITLLQCWIYEHFPLVAECNANPDYDKVSPRVCRWIATKNIVKKVSTMTYRQRLDCLRILDVCWMPYAEHRPVQDFHPISCFSGQLQWGPVVVRYRSERFGYVQCIPAHSVHSWVSYDDVDNTWTHYSDHLAAGDLCVVPGQCAPDYIDWFFVISHPFMTAPQMDPPRDVYAT
ncbi:Protein MAIN-LIKE 1 [Glycine max]|nr:Protein MAIN-LIKE 1 [Glycine max]